MAIRRPVIVTVRIGYAATALTRCDLVGIVRAAVVAIGCAITVGIGIRCAATA